MQCVISQQNLKILCRGLHSLSRIGDELYVEPTEEGMCFRTVNAAQSAYSSLFFNLSFFSKYKSEFESEDGGTSKIAMKACLRVFKTPNCMDRNVESCKIEIDKECTKLIFQISFVKGYTKTHFLSISDNETVQLKYNKNEMSNNIGVMSRILYNSIKHFGLKDEEITFDVTNDKVHMRNYFESSELGNQNIVRTNLCLQRSDFETYDVSKPNSITFALRELRAVCAFSESSNALIGIHFEMCGKPVIFTIENPLYQADYVVSTLPPEMISGEKPYRRSQLTDVASSMPSTSANSTRKRKSVSVTEDLIEDLGVEPIPTTEEDTQVEPNADIQIVVEADVHREDCDSENTVPRSSTNNEQSLAQYSKCSLDSNTQHKSSTNEKSLAQNNSIRSFNPSAQQRSGTNDGKSVAPNPSRCSFGPNDSDVNMEELMMNIDMESQYFQVANSKLRNDEEISGISEEQYDAIEDVYKNCFKYFTRECTIDDVILCKEEGD